MAKAAGKRVRDPDLHRAAILDAARACFAESGYAGTTIRKVAARAGVTHGLVLLHFNSKEELFLAALPGTRDLAEHVAGDLETLPDRIAEAFVARMEAGADSDPFVALVRSAATETEAAKQLLAAMREQSLAIYSKAMDAPDTAARVDLLGSHLIGVTFSRYVLASGPVAEMSAKELTAYLTANLRAILFGPVPAAAKPAKAAS